MMHGQKNIKLRVRTSGFQDKVVFAVTTPFNMVSG